MLWRRKRSHLILFYTKKYPQVSMTALNASYISLPLLYDPSHMLETEQCAFRKGPDLYFLPKNVDGGGIILMLGLGVLMFEDFYLLLQNVLFEFYGP
jgi:hypothetical protein